MKTLNSRQNQFVMLLTLMMLFVVGIASAGSYWGSWGSWSGSWSDRPTDGKHSWYNYSTSTSWWTYYKWNISAPNSGRHMELEYYDPGTGNHCDRLEPTTLTEYGGDWIGNWSTDNECGNWGDKERLKFDIKNSNVTVGNTYYVNTLADILYSAGYGGEVNVSFANWSSDDWLGKLTYDSSYKGISSSP